MIVYRIVCVSPYAPTEREAEVTGVGEGVLLGVFVGAEEAGAGSLLLDAGGGVVSEGVLAGAGSEDC